MHCAVLKVNRRNCFWQQLQSMSRTKPSGVAYVGVDLTEPKQQYREHHIYPICLMLQRPKSIMMKEVSAQTKALSVVFISCGAVCCLVALEHAKVGEKKLHSQISQTFTTKVFPVCSEWVSRVCAQGIIKITNHGQIKQIRTNILMQPVLCLLTTASLRIVR